MSSKDTRTSEYEPLDGMGAEDEFSLEDILAEYGGGRRQAILRDVEAVVNPGPEPVFQPEEPPKEEVPPAKTAEDPQIEEPVPKAPRPVTLEEVVGSTVSAVMEEQQQEPLVKPRRRLFSHRKIEDTEQLYPAAEEEEELPEEEEELIEEEEELSDAAVAWREKYQNQRGLVPAAFVSALAPILGRIALI